MAGMTKQPMTNEQQAVKYCRGQLQVVTARAGTGKTHTMVAKIADLLKDGVPAHQIVAITFTVAGARELANRLPERIGFCGTLHSWAMRALGISGDQIASEDEADTLIREAMADLNIRGTSVKAVTLALADGVGLGDVGVAARRVAHYLKAEGRHTLDMVLTEYRDHLRSEQGKERQPFEVLVVDEAQDTGPVDAEIYDLFRARSKVVIGDPLQAIFGFRGCSTRFFRKMERRATDVLPLSQTFRCSPAIVEAANRLFPDEPPMTAAREDPHGQLLVVASDNEAEESSELANWCETHPDQSKAILCRYNADVQRVAMDLRRRGIPVLVRGEEPCPLLLAALRALQSPTTENVDVLREELGDDRWLKLRGRISMISKLTTDLKAGLVDLAAALLLIGIDGDKANDATGNDVTCTIDEALEAAVRCEPPGGAPLDAVTVSTVHAAKGREWDRVALAACTMPPPKADLEEEQRIFYVAITRARFSVLATFARNGVDSRTGAFLKNKPSPFLKVLEA